MNVGILDFGSNHNEKKHSQHVLDNLVSLVPLAEELGFHRYWLGEHYGANAWGNPEILVGLLLGITEKIKIGPAGILLQLHSPFRIAQSFRMLNLFFLNRVDLGIARATSNSICDKALLDGAMNDFSLDSFRRKFRELVHFLDDDFPNQHPYSKINSYPPDVERPNIWVLGSSNTNIEMAVDTKAKLCLSHFYHAKSDLLIQWIKEYKDTFQEKHLAVPESSIAITCLCVENEKRVNQIMKQIGDQNLPLQGVKINMIVTRSEIKEKLLTFQHQHQVDEILLLNVSETYEDKLELMHLVAEELNLKE